MRLNFIIALILSIIVASFAIVNSKVVAINLLFTTVSVSQALVIFISVSIGAIIALLFGFVKEFKLRREVKENKQELKKLRKENKSLKQKLKQFEKNSDKTNINEKEQENLIVKQKNSKNENEEE